MYQARFITLKQIIIFLVFGHVALYTLRSPPNVSQVTSRLIFFGSRWEAYLGETLVITRLKTENLLMSKVHTRLAEGRVSESSIACVSPSHMWIL